MNNTLRVLFSLLVLLQVSCGSSKKEHVVTATLYSIEDTSGGISRYGYKDSIGNMIVPFGKYTFNYSDTIKSIGFVLIPEKGIWAIDKQGDKLFQTYPSPNNGPDEVYEGLFRILGADGTIGFADMDGRIVISPRFSAISTFSNGKATFCQGCPLGAHKAVQTDEFRQAMLKLRNKMPDMIFIISERKYGSINLRGDTILRPVYERIYPTRDGITMVLKDRRAFYVDSIGNEVTYDSLKHPNQQPINKDIAKHIMHFRDEEELLKLGTSF